MMLNFVFQTKRSFQKRSLQLHQINDKKAVTSIFEKIRKKITAVPQSTISPLRIKRKKKKINVSALDYSARRRRIFIAH